MELIEDWRERLEEGIRHQAVVERAALLERLIVAHESYEEIMQSWETEVARRIANTGDDTGWIPAEVVLAELAAKGEEARKNWRPPPIPEDIRDIEDQALHLTDDDFYALLVNVEAELPSEVDPHWRAEIRTRIEAVPAEIERRYREEEEAFPLNEAERRMELVRSGRIRLLDADEVLADPDEDDGDAMDMSRTP